MSRLEAGRLLDGPRITRKHVAYVRCGTYPPGQHIQQPKNCETTNKCAFGLRALTEA